MRGIEFSKRNIKEILRDPLSYIFCIGFPVVMLIIMSVVDKSIPKEANMTLFHIENLAPGMVVFGLSFVMLFTAIQFSKDRGTAFLMRLYASPMKPVEYIIGYTLPSFVMALIQICVTYICAIVIAASEGKNINLGYMIISIGVLVPAILLYLAFGLLFGALFNDKAAPGISSIVISLSCMVGGIWMDVDGMGGQIKSLSHALPFYHGVRAARLAFNGSFDMLAKPLLIALLYATVIYILAVIVMRSRMKKDIR